MFLSDSDLTLFIFISPLLLIRFSSKSTYLLQIEIDTLRAQLNKVKVKLGILEEDKDTCEAKSRDLKVQSTK